MQKIVKCPSCHEKFDIKDIKIIKHKKRDPIWHEFISGSYETRCPRCDVNIKFSDTAKKLLLTAFLLAFIAFFNVSMLIMFMVFLFGALLIYIVFFTLKFEIDDRNYPESEDNNH